MKNLVAKLFVKISNPLFVKPQVACPVPWLGRLMAGLSPRRSVFGPSLVHVFVCSGKNGTLTVIASCTAVLPSQYHCTSAACLSFTGTLNKTSGRNLGTTAKIMLWQMTESTSEQDRLCKHNLILYGPSIILQYICNPTRYTIFYD